MPPTTSVSGLGLPLSGEQYIYTLTSHPVHEVLYVSVTFPEFFEFLSLVKLYISNAHIKKNYFANTQY